MGSKIFVLLGLSIAFVLLVSSEVAARDLAETAKQTEGASLDNHGGDGRGGYNELGGYNGGGGNYNNGGGHYNGGGGSYNNGGGHYNGGGGGHYNGGGGGGYYNGGGGHYNGGCCHGYCQYKHRCCNSAAEALENTQVKPQN